MAKFTVTVKEIYDSYVEIEAESKADAIQKVRDGEGVEVDLEYHSTLNALLWNAHENVIDECTG